MNKCLTLGIVFIFAMSLVVVSAPTLRADSPRTLTVPDQYPTIQDAIGNASAGDTVYVKDGTYNITGFTGITINKPISLIGQDNQATTIEGTASYYANFLIDITAENVVLSGFTIISNFYPTAIHLPNSNCKITNNKIENSEFAGIDSEVSDNNVISSNSITNNDGYGIYFASSNSIISNNTITDNKGTAIIIDSSQNVTVSRNHISNNGNGILIRFYGNFYISDNDITDNAGYGIQFGENCSNSFVYDNNLIHNQIGIDLMNFATTTSLAPLRVDGYPLGRGNVVYNNRFIYNKINAKVENAFPYDVGYVNNGTDMVSWDKGSTGNYWSDYNNPFAYVIDANNVDHHPLPYLSTLMIILITALVIILIAVVILQIYRRSHRKTVMDKKS